MQGVDDELAQLRMAVPVGTRVVHAEGGHRGTVRAVVALAKRKDLPALVMLGIEWDEARGMHDGTFDGERIFACRDKHGSFVVPAKVLTACGLDEVLFHRFTDEFANSSSNVENLLSADPTRRDDSDAFVNVWNVDCSAGPSMLRVARCGPRLGALFPNIRRLSVTSCLLSGWSEVAAIANQLTQLEEFSIRGNKLGVIDDDSLVLGAYPQVKSLNVADTGISPKCVRALLAAFPLLETLHAGANPLRRVVSAKIESIGSCEHAPNVHTVSLDLIEFETINEVRDVLGLLAANVKSLNLNQTAITNLEGLGEGFPALERLMIRDNHIAHWDALVPLHEADTVQHLCFSSEALDGALDTSHQRRQHLVALMPRHVSHLNRSYIRDSEYDTARQAVMTHYLAHAESRARMPSIIRRLVEDQEAEGVRVFVPTPKRIELEVTFEFHAIVVDGATLDEHVHEYFSTLLDEASRSESQRKRVFECCPILLRTPRQRLRWTTEVRQSVGDLKRKVADAFGGLGLLAAATDATTDELHDLALCAANQSQLRLFHIDTELAANPGAVARGFHFNELKPDRPPIHNWRIKNGDHLVAALANHR
jgi:hypothetical protein